MTTHAERAVAGGYTLTRHAEQRREEFGLTKAEVSDILLNYDVRYAQNNRGVAEAVCQKGPWSIAIDEQRCTVITILRRSVKDWSH